MSVGGFGVRYFGGNGRWVEGVRKEVGKVERRSREEEKCGKDGVRVGGE